jgi:hypothetical protein
MLQLFPTLGYDLQELASTMKIQTAILPLKKENNCRQ